jgi:hypothetical protein
VRAYLSLRFPALERAPLVEARSCRYELTPDTHFIAAVHPAQPTVWLVGGGSGHGFKHGPAMAERLAAAIVADAALPNHFALGELPLAQPAHGGLGHRDLNTAQFVAERERVAPALRPARGGRLAPALRELEHNSLPQPAAGHLERQPQPLREVGEDHHCGRHQPNALLVELEPVGRLRDRRPAEDADRSLERVRLQLRADQAAHGRRAAPDSSGLLRSVELDAGERLPHLVPDGG